MKCMPLHFYLVLLLVTAGCRNEPSTEEDRAAPRENAASPPTNRVDIPPTVRKNLGITFAKVEVRNVGRTIRVPGCFELPPEARREYRTMAAGRVEQHAAQYANVETGQVLYTLDSSAWRELQQRINETDLDLRQACTSVDAMAPLIAAKEKHLEELERVVEIWTERVEKLGESQEMGVVSEEDLAQAHSSLAASRSNLAGVSEELTELRLRKAMAVAEVDAHQERFELLLANASSMLSMPVNELIRASSEAEDAHPRWKEIRQVEVRAGSPGIVESLPVTNGAWVDRNSLILTTVTPDRVRFRAMGLQADLPRLNGSAQASIAPPRSPGLDIGDVVNAEVQIGLDAHPDNRTITLIARPAELRPWMRAGVSAFLEVVADGSGGNALAIPRSAVVKDGITHVFFRRDPKNPNQAIRVEADMGPDDGRWVVIHSGLKRGDEVVLDGAYELKLATTQSGAASKGGHFHADGSFHGEH